MGEVKAVPVKGKLRRLNSYYERNVWTGRYIHEGKYVLDGTIGNPLSHYLMSSLFFASKDKVKAAYPLRIRAELYNRGHGMKKIDRAFESQKLFSDLGVEWAYKTDYFSANRYFDLS
jgi:hypothetical protein